MTDTPRPEAAQAAASIKPRRHFHTPQPIDPALRKRRLAEMINLSARTSRREIAAMVQELRSLANPLGDDVPRMFCMVCGIPFEARSDDARFCSGRCRIRNWRAQR